MTDPGQADLIRQLLETTACWSASQLQEEWTPATPVSSRTVCRILAHNGLHGCIAAQKSALNKRQLRNRVAYAKAHSLAEGWTADRTFYFSDESSVELHPKHCQYCRRPSEASLDPWFTQKTVKFGGGKIMVWGYIQYGGAREICKVDGNIDSAKYQQILASQYIPNYKRGPIFQQDAPCHTSGSTMKFLRGKKIKVLQGWPAQSPNMNIIEHIWGRMKEEAWRTRPKKLGGALGCLQGALPCHPRRLHQQALRLCQTGWQLFCRPKEPIQDINYLTFCPWWKTRLIFILFYLLFEKDKMYWL